MGQHCVSDSQQLIDPSRQTLWSDAAHETNFFVCEYKRMPPDDFAKAVWRLRGYGTLENAQSIPDVHHIALKQLSDLSRTIRRQLPSKPNDQPYHFLVMPHSFCSPLTVWFWTSGTAERDTCQKV